MARTEIETRLVTSLQDVVTDDIKDRVTQDLKEHKNIDSQESIEPEATTEIFAATDEAKKVLDWFAKYFKPKHLKKLGLQKIELTHGKWYVPWDAGFFSVDLEPDQELVDAKLTRPSYEDPVQQSLHELRTYLSHKWRRRSDKSRLAKTHKTLLAKLCHKCIERIELLRSRKQKRDYYILLKQFLETVRQDLSLIGSPVRGKDQEEHIEDFIIAQIKICEQRQCYLTYDEPPAALSSWADTLDQELAALHICGARTFHFLLQNKTIPDNLEKHLRSLGTTYHRLMLPDDQKAVAGERLRLVNRHRSHWESIAQSAQEKLKRMCVSLPLSSLGSVMSHIHAGTLSLEEAVFTTVGEYYTADQCLYLALYKPDYLPLSESEKIDLFGSQEFLQLYNTQDHNPVIGFQWLSWHIQQASTHLFPALQVLAHCDNEDDDSFHKHLKALVQQVRELRQAPTHCPVLSHIGALPELGKAITYQTGIINEFEQHLTRLQQHLHCLVLVRALLAQYRQLLPQTGELIGALALQTDLTLLAQVVSQTIKDMQIELTHLLPLQGMGFVGMFDGSQKLVVTKQSSLLDVVDGIRKPSKGLITWRTHKAAREKALDDLEARLSICHDHATQIHAKTSPKRLQHMVKKTKRQFQLARLMLSEGLSDHLSEKQHTSLKQGEGVIVKWLEVVDTGLAEHKRQQPSSPAPAAPSVSPSVSLPISLSNSSPIVPLTPPLSSSDEKKLLADHKIMVMVSSSSTPATVASAPLPEIQSSTLTRVTPPLETKAMAVINGLDGFINRACPLLQRDDKGFTADWEQLLDSAQEEFFNEFAKIRSDYNDTTWMQFFQTKLGILFSPLPPIQKPTYFLWWYRHTIADRRLFFRMLAFSALINRAKQPSQLTTQQQTHLHSLLQSEGDAVLIKHHSHWSWLDGLQRNLKSKCLLCHTRLQQLNQEALAIPLAEHKSVPAPTEPEPEPIRDAIEHRPVTITPEPILVPPSMVQRSAPVPTPTTPASTDASTLIIFRPDFKVESPQWKHYHEQLMQADDLSRQRLCLVFFSSVLMHIQRGQLSIAEHPETATRCKEILGLFWSVIHPTEIAQSLLGVSIYSLLESFQKNSPAVQQQFFVQKGQRLLKSYSHLLLPPSEPIVAHHC